jgi:hypothetical protein
MILASDHINKEKSDHDCTTARFALRNEVKEGPHDCKTDLTDFTFLIPLRIDSEKRKENADTSIDFILRHFDTTFILVEGDESKKYFPDFQTGNLRYDFIQDKNLFFHKTKYINKLIELAATRFIAVWDADAIVPPDQILESARILRTGETVMSIPYDGRVYVCDHYLSELFKRIPEIEILLELAPSLPLMYGYHSTGGAFMTNRETYLETGGENENFLGWGPEDVERVKRMEVLNLPVHFSNGPFFHLWHPRGKTSWYTDKTNEIQNRRELINTCKYA